MNIRRIAEMARQNAIKAVKNKKRIQFSEEYRNGKKRIEEMIGTPEGGTEFLEKITYDLYRGRQAVELIYKQIYTTTTDANYPKILEISEMGGIQLVFQQIREGGEVKLGTMGPGREKMIKFETWAAGLEIHEDLLVWNELFRLTEVGEAFGEAFNKFKNDFNLSPIIDGTYQTGDTVLNKKSKQKKGTAQAIAFNTDIRTTLEDALTVLPRGTKMLINSADRNRISKAIAGDMYSDDSPGPVKQRLSADDFIEYDGEEIKVGDKKYTYGGVTVGVAYLIVPKKQFREYVKQDLTIDQDKGDLTRLVYQQMVGKTRLATVAGIGGEDGAVKVALQ